MAAKGRAAKNVAEKLFTRTEIRALTGTPDPASFREYELLGLVKPRQLEPSGIWIYTRAEVEAIRKHRKSRGHYCPDVPGFD
jgi:hypothetical protein